MEQNEKKWYVIHTYSGYENRVKTNLEHRIESMDVKDKIFDVKVPKEDEVEIRDGQRRTVPRKIFPGYILVQMILTDESWYVVRNTPGVTGFVGTGTKPIPLEEEEVNGTEPVMPLPPGVTFESIRELVRPMYQLPLEKMQEMGAVQAVEPDYRQQLGLDELAGG